MINMRFGSWVKVARTLASHASLTIRYVDEDEIKQMGAQAWTDSRNIYIRKPDHTWGDSQFRLWLYFLIHEIGHNTPERQECWDIMREKQPRGLLAYALNLMEDHVQEKELHDMMPILRQYLGAGRAQFLQLMKDKRDAETIVNMKANPQGPTLFGWDNTVRHYFMPELRGWEHDVRSAVKDDPQHKEWTEKLEAGDYGDVLRNNPSPMETFILAERIVKEVFEQDPEEQQGEPSEGEGEGDGDGEQEGEGQPGNDGQGQQGDQEGEESSGSGKQGGKPSDGTSGGKTTEGDFDYADLMSHNHVMDKRNDGGNDQQHGCNIDYDKYFEDGKSYGEFIPNLEGAHEFDLPRGNYPRHDNSRTNEPVEGSTLTKRVGRYMQAHSKNRRLHGQKSGALSNKSLYKLKVKGMGQEAKRKVFNRKVVNKSKDVAVTIGIDLSGSMNSRGKADAAIASVTHLHSVIHGALRIPLEILGFSETWGEPEEVARHVVFQGFDAPRRNDQVEADLRRIMPFQGANRDGEFLMWARERLLAKRAARHIMIILSDGQPRADSGDIARFTHEMTQQIEKEGLIELHAIGIISDSVRHFYSSYDVIGHVHELEEKLLTVLKNKIIINL